MARKKDRLLNIICVCSIVCFLSVLTVLVVKYVEVRNENARLVRIKADIEEDYEELLDQSEKLKDDTYYTIYFEDKYMVIDKDNIIIEFK